MALTVHDFSLTLPAVVEHGSAASAFAILTGLVALMSGIEGKKTVSAFNFILFFITILGGSTGFAFLGNTTSIYGIGITNMSMAIVVGIGIPITGFSLARMSSREKDGPSLIMTYLALVSLSLTVIAGTGTASMSIFNLMILNHLTFAALTVSFTFGVLVILLLKAFSSVPRRVVFSLLSLAFTVTAGGTGTVYLLLSGGIPYAVGMAELAIIVYGFLMLSTGINI